MAEVANSNLLQTGAGLPGVKGVTVVVIRTEWNDAIVGALEKGCRQVLEDAGAICRVITVPGAFDFE